MIAIKSLENLVYSVFNKIFVILLAGRALLCCLCNFLRTLFFGDIIKIIPNIVVLFVSILKGASVDFGLE